MIRSLLSGAFHTSRRISFVAQRCIASTSGFSSAAIFKPTFYTSFSSVAPRSLLQVPVASTPITATSTRSVTKFSLIKGKRKSVKAVVKRFKRLDWGAWIRTHSGRHKKLFKKSCALRRRLRQHIFTNSQQSWLLDKMVTNFWRRPKYYIDDPYTPYHTRDEFFATKGKTFKV